MVLEIRVVVFNFVETSTKNFLQLTVVMKCQLSATSRVLFLMGITACLHIAIYLGKSCLCKRGRSGLCFELRDSDCTDKTYNDFSLMKNISSLRTVNCNIITPPQDNSVVCFHFHFS